MEGEILYLRKQVMGGFNRKDVTAYIAKLSKERAEALSAAEAAENEITKLRGEISRLQEELKNAADKSESVPETVKTETPETKESDTSKKVIKIKRIKTKKWSESNDF